METKNYITENKLIVIMRGLEKDQALRCAEAMYQGGIRLIEVTFDATKPESVTGEMIADMCKTFGTDLCIGAGTVVTENQLTCAVKNGAKYIISPNTDEKIISMTKKLGAVSIPGALTPSEAVSAHTAGADFVKIFPVGALGSNYIKDISAPLGYIDFLAVGGVNLTNMEHFIKQGAKGVGIGGNIVNLEYINNCQYDKICELAKSYTNKIKEISNGYHN